MPIPELGEKASREEVIKKYDELGWSKILRVEWVEMIRGKPHLRIIDFNADTMQCDLREDIPHQLTFVQFRPTGIMWTCGICGKTDGPIANENGRMISDKEIGIEEAFHTIEKTGQYIPVGLRRGSRGRVTRVI